MVDTIDKFLNNLLRIDEADYPIDYMGFHSGPPTPANYPSVAPRNYAGFSGPQAPPPSIQIGGPAAIAQWQDRMNAIGGGASGGGAGGRGGGGRGGGGGGGRRGGGTAPGSGSSTPPGGGGAGPGAGGDDAFGGGGLSGMGAATGIARGLTRGMGGVPRAAGFGGGMDRLARAGVPEFQTGRAAKLLDPTSPTRGIPNLNRPFDTPTPGDANGLWDEHGRFKGALDPNSRVRVAGTEPAGPARPGQEPGVNRAAELKAGNAEPAPTGAGTAAAAGEGGGFWRSVGNVVRPITKFAGRAFPVLDAGISGTEEYQKSHDPTRAALVGGSTGLGTWGGAAAGAELGAGIGAAGGPFAPFTVPIGAVSGGIIGGLAGHLSGHSIGTAAADVVSPQKPATAPPATPPPATAPTAPAVGSSTPPATTAGGQPLSGNLKAGGALDAARGQATKTNLGDWKMTWNDYAVLAESEKRSR